MNGKQSKKLRAIARMIHHSIPEAEGKIKKSVGSIYDGLKLVHKNKHKNAITKPTRTN